MKATVESIDPNYKKLPQCFSGSFDTICGDIGYYCPILKKDCLWKDFVVNGSSKGME